jgi:hypothetical protein
MNKMLIALIAAFLAVTSFYGSDARAGCGGGGYFRPHHRHVYQSVQRHVRRKVEVAKAQPAEPVTVAKVEDTPETTSDDAVTENSSIATTADKVAEVNAPAPEKKVVASKNLGCKQFFPSVGMTLSVSCN